jgi:outer membrane lipoprotein-sorting protein
MTFSIRLGSTLAIATVMACLLGIQSANGQTDQTPQLAEDVFQNVPILRGMPVDQFMDTMGMISAATSLNCTDCHFEDGSDSWDKFAIETPLKETARAMIRMVSEINRANFGGLTRVTCFTCHQGSPIPKSTASLEVQYASPPDDPNEIFFPAGESRGLPTVDQVFDKYIGALGGAERLGDVTSFVARGTYSGYDTSLIAVPFEIFAAAPNQRAEIVELPYGGAKVRTYDGNAAWIASPDMPLPLMPRTGPHLKGAKMDAMLSFPAQIRQISNRWRIGFSKIIDGRDVHVVQGTTEGDLPVNLYFDDESGLLVRLVRFADTPIGSVATRIDYTEYREVAGGIMMPVGWTETWTGGQVTVELSEVQPNASIDAARFQRPPPAEPFASQ